MPAPSSLIRPDGSLTELACEVLHTVTDVPLHLLQHARIRKAYDNWLRVPWYSYHRGGAITVGRTIWFTGKWFASDGYSDGSIESTWRWLQHLAHEVGHLPQAARFGFSILGKSRYILAFAWQYGTRAITMRSEIHDGAQLEIEADMGRWVLTHLIGKSPLSHPLIRFIHARDEGSVRELLFAFRSRIMAIQEQYRRERLR